MIARVLGRGCLAFALAMAPAVGAQPPTNPAEPGAPVPARFALVLGVNKSLDPDAPVLRYADDDAAKYQELFRGLGARTYLVARFDANTASLHGQAVAEARAPTQADLARTLEELEADVHFARAKRLRTIVYVVYSGHGDVDDGRAYLTLEDARLYGSDLDRLIFDRVGASEYHVIVDACYSYLLASARGPGGTRHELHDFAARPGIRPRANVGLLFSTSSARESHEWEGVEAGVFSHEVRSGLYGAADANGDGVVTYAEIAAFIERANAAIPGERFRPDVYARPPQGATALVDLRSLPGHKIEILGLEHAHYTLESSRGVQIAEFHNGPDQAVTLLEPAQSSPLYLRRVDDDTEFAIPMGPELVRLADLRPKSSPVAARGAAAHAFRRMFSLPFGPGWVHGLADDPAPVPAEGPKDPLRKWIGWTIVGVGAVGIAGGIVATVSAAQTRAGLDSSATGSQAASVNQTLVARRWQAALGFGIGAAAGASGIAVLFWPRSASASVVRMSAGLGTLDVSGAF
jgi:hypothetical protein